MMAQLTGRKLSSMKVTLRATRKNPDRGCMVQGVGGLILGVLVLMFGTDSLSKGVLGFSAYRPKVAFASALIGTPLTAALPALAVTLMALWSQRQELAVGALIGGSIAQLGLVLAIAALIAPLTVRVRAFSLLAPALIGATLLLWLLAYDYQLSRLDAVLLLLAGLAVLVLCGRAARATPAALRTELAPPARQVSTSVLALRIVIGIALLTWGARLVVMAAAALGVSFGWSPLQVGLTLLGASIALASASAPLLAAQQGRGDLAVGHALSGALVKVSLLLALLALWQPLPMAYSLRWVEIPALFVLVLALYPMLRSDGVLSRREAAILLVAYIVFLVVEAGVLGAH